MKARRKGTKKIIEVEVLRPRMYRQKDKHGRVVEDFEEGELELLQELTQSTSDHWQDLRERAAIAILQAMVTDKDFQRYSEQYKSEMAVKQADALIKKTERRITMKTIL